jgi:tripartite-type tricarboxylate transporter receptor subunit TctC
MVTVRRFVQGACFVLASVGFGSSTTAHAQAFPPGVIRIVVPTPPGTPPDIISRVVAAQIAATEGWRIVVENKPGALQTVGMAEVLRQPADGLTIYPMSVPTMAVPALLPHMGLRPDVDFAPVAKVSKSFNVLVVTPSFPVRTIAELVSALKHEPGKFNFSSAGFGTPAHLIGEMFKLQNNVQAAHIPYQQAQQRIGDLLTGTNHFDFLASVSASDFIASGKLRALAVTSPDRVIGLNDVPSVVEQGFPGLVVEDYVGFAVKSGTSPEIVERLNGVVNHALKQPNVREAFATLGAEPAGGSSAEFGDLIKSQVAHWGRVVRDSGIKLSQ